MASRQPGACLKVDAMKKKDNGQILREIIAQTGLSQQKALDKFNHGQARPLSLSQWKAYIADKDSARRSPCPDWVIEHAITILGGNKKR